MDFNFGPGYDTSTWMAGPDSGRSYMDADNNSQDLGYGYGNWSGDQLSFLGLDGQSPFAFSNAGTGSNGTDQYNYITGLSDPFQQAMRSRNLSPYVGQGESGYISGFANNKGQQVGPVNTWSALDREFGVAASILGAAAGGMGAGATAAGMGAGATGQAIASGAAAGSLGAAAGSNVDPKAGLVGAATGALGGAVGGFNPAGYANIEDPQLAQIFNKGVGSAVSAGVQGQNPLKAAGGSLLGSGLSYGMQTGAQSMFGMPDTPSTDSWDFNAAPNDQMSVPSSMPQSPLQSGIQQSGLFNQSPGSGMNNNFSFAMPQQNYNNGASPNMGGTAPPQQQNPFMDLVRKGINSFTGGNMNQPGAFDNIAGNLLQMYQSRRNAGQYGNLAGGLASLYTPNSPYAQQLNQTLTRQDAAAGRRSQYGTRNVELQARLAQLNSQNAPELARLYGSQENNQAQMLQSMLRMAPGLRGMFQGSSAPPTQNNNGYGGYGDVMYGDGYGPQ